MFGTFKNIQNMNNLNWNEGSYKQKLVRILISYVTLIPSWVLQYYLPFIISKNIVTSFVINEFFFNMIHLAFIVYIEFGYYPYHIFKRLKLVNSNVRGYSYLHS